MLILAKITGTSAGGYAEYLEGKTTASELGDYYLKDGERAEAPGRWVGGAEQFAIDPARAVTGEQLHALMAVARPDTGKELRRAGGSGEAVAAIDATFSAPKSVSAVWALADRGLRMRIEQAHEAAIDRALGYAARQVPMLRRRVGQDTVVHEKPISVVATSWRHTTARVVADQVPDPQLHSHVLLHAAVRRDGRLVAIDSRSWLVHQREVGAAYRTELARELHQLGFEIRRGTGRGGRYFELAGVPQGLLDRWSSRHHQVQAAIAKRIDEKERELQVVIATGGEGAGDAVLELDLLRQSGQLSPAQERLMGTVTRSAKAAVTVADLDTQWQRTALGLGASRMRIEVLCHQAHPALEPARPAQVLAALTEFDATFPAREARAVALERSAGAPIQAALERLAELRQRDEILVLADGTGTTRDHRGRERTVVAITQRLSQTTLQTLPASVSTAEMDQLNRELATVGGALSNEQREAIRLGCGEHQLVVIEGQAGTGKSTTLTGIARAHQACGREIIVTSTAAVAAERLATELADHGVTCTPHSTVGLQGAIDRGRLELTPDTTVIHDEAALASTREQLQLLRAVESSGARLIEVGDPRQNQPVGAGGLWTHIEHTTLDHDAHVELTANQRAQDPADRQAQAWFREGEVELAIRSYATRDRVHTEPDQRLVEDRALEAAHADRNRGVTTIVIAQTSNEHLDQLNARAQAIRRQHRELGEEVLDLPGRPYGLSAGDEVQIRHTIQHVEHGQLRNGTSARVTQVDTRAGELQLDLPDGSRLVLSEDQIAEADLRLAYVQHPFPAQGRTTDTAHLIVAEHATREGTYVALTRARQQTRIYATEPEDLQPDVERLQQLAEHVNRTEPDLPSIHTPLAHERIVTDTAHGSKTPDPRRTASPDLASDQAAEIQPPTRQGSDQHHPAEQIAHHAQPDTSNNNHQAIQPDELDELTPTSDRAGDKEQTARRRWPRGPDRDGIPEHTLDHLERDQTPGWEP